MKSFKKIIIGLLTLTLVLGIAGCTSSKTKDEGQETKEDNNPEIAAMVGEEPIYQSQVDQQMDYIKSMMQMQFGENYKEDDENIKKILEQQEKEYLNYLIEAELFVQKAKTEGLKASEEDIQAKYDETKATYETEEAFLKALEENGLTEETYKQRINDGIVMDDYMKSLTADIAVTDEEIKEYYDANIAQFTTGAGANMAHILVDTEEKAKEVKAEYEKGTSFEDLAATYGTDGTKDKGGDLGFVTYDSQNLDADFLAGAKELKEGEVSEPVKTQFGYHLIKVTGIKGESTVQPLEEVKNTIQSTLQKEKETEILQKAIEELKKEITVDILSEK